MTRLARKAVLAFATVSFVAMVTSVSLQLHLLSHNHPEEHDAEHCSICQQLLIAPGKFITGPESTLLDFNLQGEHVEFQSQSYVIAFHFEPFGPRPPPLLFKS